jgi:ABC-type transport system involved in cytochrome c biogenesis ATPase subunit
MEYMSKLSLLFKDTKKWVTIDLSKNNILYGINGRGKTRVLRAIETLHEIIDKNNYKDVVDLLKSLNLDDLKINNSSYKSLFLNIDDLKEFEEKELKKFIDKNQDALVFLIERLETYMDYAVRYISSIDSRKIKTIHNKLNFFISYNLDSMKSRFTYNDFNNVLSEVELVVKRSKRLSMEIDYSKNHSLETLDRLISEIMDVQNYLKINFSTLFFEQNLVNDEKKKSLSENKKQIINKLKKNVVCYFSIDPDNNNTIFEHIKERINDVNNIILESFWSRELRSLNLDFVEEINRKVHIFNKVIQKYENITLFIDKEGNCTFHKFDDKLDISLFSSGEKRIITLFLTMIFSDANIFLIDEPELSLSLNYQSKIVKDLVGISDGKSIILATHAPFIFEDFTAYGRSIKVEV